MAVYIVVDNAGIVINRIEWNGEHAIDHLKDFLLVQHDEADIGWKWDAEKKIPYNPNPSPPEPPPAQPLIATGKTTVMRANVE